MAEKHLSLLSLDGGGVRGLSSLLILKHLMESIDPDAETPPNPCDYFDMIGGTSTGGLIAIMLGRLRMSVDECIDAYIKLSGDVFQEKHYLPVTISGKVQARFDSGVLETAVRNIVAENDLSKNEDLLLFDNNPSPCRVFVCATSKQLAMETVKLTSYRNPRHLGDLLKTTKIWQAARATSAASTFFEPIEIGPNDEEFVDGASGANNPIRELWTEASDIWRDFGPLHETIKCLVSIGTGAPAIKPFGSSMLEVAKTLKDISLETERTAKKFSDEHYQLRLEGRYFRFNVTKGLEDVGLENANKRREIAAATRAYISETKEEMENCYNNLKERERYLGRHNSARRLPRPSMKGNHTFPTFDPAGDLSRNFIERPSLLQTISDCLEQSPAESAKSSLPRVAVVHSLAGSGKSQIARKFASYWLERHTSFYWFDASSSSTLDNSFRGFARDASIIDAAASTSDESAYVRRKVCEWILKYGGEWLLVYDNYDIMELREDDDYNISKYFPLSASGRILVTTRNREVQTVTGGTLVDIGTMTEEESIALFVKSANLNLPDQTSDEWAELREIACQLLGSYPLAIAQGASYLRLGYMDETSDLSKLQRYKKQYSSHEVAILKAEGGMKVREYGQSVITTWDMSFEIIVSNNPAAAELLLLFGFFHHSVITMDLFVRAFERQRKMLQADGIDLTEPTFSWLGRLLVPTSNGSWDRDFHFDVALSLLQSYSLIQRTTGGAWSVHPLVHLWTVIGKQHPRLSLVEDRARLALSMLGGMYDPSVDSVSEQVHAMRMRMSNHMTSAIKTVQRYTKLLNLHFRSAVKASTLLRVDHVFDDAVQTPQQKAQRLGTRLALQAFANGSVQDGIDHISTLQSFKAVIICLNALNEAYSEDAAELMEIPMKLLPQVAANDPDVELKTQQLTFRMTLVTILNRSGQHEKINDFVEESIQFADECELEVDESYRLQAKGALLNTLTVPSQLGFQSDESKRLLLRRLEAFHEDCQFALGESHKTTVETLLGIAGIYRDIGQYERVSHLLNDLTTLYQRSPETLAPVYQRCLIQRTGLALKTKQVSKEIEAFSQLVEIMSKTSGPFDSETIDHKLSLISSSFRKASMENSKYQPLITNRDKWEAADDAIWKPVGLALAYKFVGDVKEIDALWDGAIAHMLLEESPGVGIDDFVYVFEVAAEESKRSTYQEVSNIMQRQVTRLRDLKKHMTQRIGLSRSAVLTLLKGFWGLVDSIGPFASSAEPRLMTIYLQHSQGLDSPNLWPKPRIFDIEGGQTEEQKARSQLGQSIITKIRSSPGHAKPYMLFMCVHSLELYYYGETTRESAPLDARSIDLLQKMAIKQFGEAHVLSLRMHFVNAITSQLLNAPIRREESEACIMEHRFKDIGRQGNRTSLSASSIFERLNTEYKKRGWYSLCRRLYEVTFQKLSISLGWCHEDTMQSLWFLLEMYWRVDGQPKFSLALQEIDTLYQRTEPNWKETFFVRMRQGGEFLLTQDLPEPASLVFRQVFTWVETFPHEKHDAKWMAQTWRYHGEALDTLGDEKGARDSKIQAELFDARAS